MLGSFVSAATSNSFTEFDLEQVCVYSCTEYYSNWILLHHQNRGCLQRSHNAIFHWNFQKYSYKSCMLSLTECVWEFQNDALWDTHYHAMF